jgi:nucleotide-binding universal stress UspA family protein
MFKRILLAVDDSESSSRAIEACAEMAEAHGSEVVVLHVREREVIGGPRSSSALELEEPPEARVLVDRAVNTLTERGLGAKGTIVNGTVGRTARVIIDTAEADDAGLIVMGSRGLSDWEGLFVGSVTHRVLHLARMPVLAVP